MTLPVTTPTLTVQRTRLWRARRRRLVIAALLIIGSVIFICSLLFGVINYTPAQAWRALFTNQTGEATFMVRTLRLPRAVVGALAGMSFGLAGSTFQTMLRNPLASPDIIGISSGASAAAAIGIIFFNLTGIPLKVAAVACGLLVALAVYALGGSGKTANTKVILIGIGMAAMADGITTFALDKAPQWNLQQAMRWLTGSLGGANSTDVIWLALSFSVCAPLLLIQMRSLASLQLGEETATALGTRVQLTRLFVTISAIALVGLTTAVTGPIAFVAFLSGPIVDRLINDGFPVLVPAALMGAVLVLAADFLSQVVLPMHYPVGVVTGILGAPYLIYLVARANSGRK